MNTITLRIDKSTPRFGALVAAVNQGIDAHLEAITESKFQHCGGVIECDLHEKDLPVLYRRLAEQHDPEADKIIADIERLKTIDFDEFTKAYLTSALWSSGDMEAGCEQFESKYTIADIHPDSILKAANDCAQFQRENEASLVDYPTSSAGHDFWLTRCGHGCGFWENDHGTEEQCKKLTESSHRFGEVDLYIGDDGKLHFSR